MSFYIHNVNVAYPCGVIISYVGNTDPNGWLICNGRALSGFTDPKYNNLKTLLSPATTLPDLRNRTLLGKSNTSTAPVSSGNTTLFTLTENNLPIHNHVTLSITNHSASNNHTHTYGDRYHDDTGPWVEPTTEDDPDTGDATTRVDVEKATQPVSHTHNLLNAGTGSGTPINFLNKCYKTNWIIKY